MELTDIKGIGRSTAGKLAAADITTVQQLAQVDLRTHHVNGLSNQNISQLRNRAQHLLQAQKTSDLTLIHGLGPSARDKLNAAGIKTIHDLLTLDLRSTDVDGLSTPNLQKLKHNATYLRTN